MKKINSIFKFFVLLSALLAGANSVWGGTSTPVYAKAEAYAVPSKTGYIWVTIKGTNFNASRDFTKDDYDSSETSGSNSQWIGTPANKKTFTATYYAKPKDGYTFVGWFSDPNCTNLISSSTSNNCKYETSVVSEKTSSPGEVLTLYAKFTNEYVVTFDANGGAFEEGTTSVTSTQTYGTPYSFPTNAPTRGCTTFKGWYTSKTGGQPVTNVATAGNHTLYAQWNDRVFSFSVTAMVNNEAYGSASAEVDDECIIAESASTTSASTTATFTATPNPGYRFVKWKNGSSDLTNGTNNPYVVTITSYSSTSTASRNYTAYFEAKKSQSISWKDGVKTNVSLEGGAVDLSDAVSVTPTGRVYGLSLISSNPEILSVEGTTIVPIALGSADIYACVIEDDEYAADTTDVALTFTVSARATPSFTVNSEYNLKVGDNFEVLSDNHSNVALIQCASESSSDIYSFTSTTTADNGVCTVTALKEGSVRLKFSQPATDGWNGGSTDWITVNISRHTTNLTVNTSAQTILVGDTYNPIFATNNSEVTPVFTSTNSSVAIYEGGVIRALAVGSATLTFSQSETDKWTGASKTINVTVEKHDNPITVKFDGETQTDNRKVLQFDGTTAITFEAANTDFVVGASSNPSIATYADGTILASHNLGEAIFTVTQEGTATHKAGSATFTIKVAYADDDCYVLNESGITNMSSGTSRTFELSGLGAQLSIEASIGSGSSSATLSIYGIDAKGVENNTPLFSRSLSNSNQTYSVPVSRDIAKLRLHATGAVFFKNLQVTRLKTIECAPMTFSENAFVGEPKKQNLPIYYSTANGDDIKIVCDNPKFTFAQTTIATEACSDATVNVEVTYTSATAGTDVARLIIYNSTNRIETTITATTVKKTQTLVWRDGISPMSVGNTHTNPASAALPLNYKVISGSAVEIVDGSKIHAIAPGTATVCAYNDGDATWNPVSDTYTFTVTELKVQRIEWMQSFTNLKTGGENIDLDAKVYVITDNGEGESAELVDRPITYTSADESVVSVINGNQLHIVGAGETTLTATQAGNADTLAASAVRPVQVRVPSDGCEMFVLEKAYGTIDGVSEKVIELTGEPETISFGAWRTAQSNRTGGNLYLSEFVDGQWSAALWSDETTLSLPTSYGPITLSHNATKIKFYTVSGATGKHSFSGVNITLARYLEFTDAPSVTEQSVEFPAATTQIGQTYTKTVNIRYSDIFDRLTVSHTNTTKFTITPTAIGNECGDYGAATISIQFLAQTEGTEEDVITITDGRKTLTINVSATTQRNDQTITFTPAESILTTDNVTLSASATSTLPVSFELVSGEDYATVNSTGVISVLQGGGSIVVRATQEGNTLYNAAPSVDKTIYINKVTPTIATAPTVASVTLPATLASAAIDGASAVVVDDKGTLVAGSFAWADAASAVAAGANSYSAIFTPTNTNFYTTATCNLSVTASKLSQTIDWSLVAGSSHHYFQPVALDATATSGLSVSYSSSDESVAKIVSGAVQFVQPGEVTLTASQAGNETYEAAESVARMIYIVKATPVVTTTPSLVTFYLGHSLSESPILGGVATVDGHVVDGNFSWKADATPTAIGYYYFPAIFTPNNTTFFDAAECDVEVRVTPYDRVFTDETGNHRWSDTRNWESGFVPTVSVDVTIADTLIVDCEAIVGELTIEENAAVLVVENGSLTVDHSGTSSNGRYGDLYVQDAASVTFNADFQLRDLYLSSLLDSYEGKSKSAQVTNPANLHIDGDVYFDLKIDASGTCSPGWYDFTVPFPVDALNGVYRIENGEVRKVTNEVNYAIMSYNESVRANGQYGWKKFRGIMQPGVCYSMTIDDVYPVYRFKKTATGALNTETTMPMTYTVGEGGDSNRGWNCLGNGTLRHADLSADGINKVQVYNHASNSYSVVSMNECSFVVGAAFFVQAVSNQSLMTLNSASHSVLRAPAAAPAYSDEHCLVLARENSASVLDRLYLSATEESKSSYLPGHDLAKFETSASTAQMWCAAFGAKLCDAELALTNNKVDFPLTISTPSAATYTLSLSKTVNSETLYLVRDGAIVWNLSLSDYTFDLPKGTDTSYSIRLVRDAYSTPTGINYLEQHSANKCLIDGVLYILRDGRMFDVEGRLVK